MNFYSFNISRFHSFAIKETNKNKKKTLHIKFQSMWRLVMYSKLQYISNNFLLFILKYLCQTLALINLFGTIDFLFSVKTQK